jgi:hypothetical protein
MADRMLPAGNVPWQGGNVRLAAAARPVARLERQPLSLQ